MEFPEILCFEKIGKEVGLNMVISFLKNLLLKLFKKKKVTKSSKKPSSPISITEKKKERFRIKLGSLEYEKNIDKTTKM